MLQALNMGPDFVVREVSAPPSTYPNGPLPVTVTVCNQGTDGDSASVELFLSADPEIALDDTLIYSEYLGWLQPGQCKTGKYYSMSSVAQGAWQVGAIADAYNNSAESDETNNVRAGNFVGLGYAPDFFIREVIVPGGVMPGNEFTASVTFCNQGTQSGSAEVLLVLSADTDIRYSYDGPPEEQDTYVFSFYPDTLETGLCRKEQVRLSVNPSQEGAWYLGAIVDPLDFMPELIRTNNTRASELFGVGSASDFRIKSVSGPASTEPGDTFTASVTVCNEGTLDGSTEVLLVISEDSTILVSPELPPEEQDQPLASFSTGPLAAGACKTQQVQASAVVPQYGAWYLGAAADPNNFEPELIETNNTRAGELMGVGSAADYVIREVSGPASAAPGMPFMVSVTVCNQGTMGDGTQVQLVLSGDTDIRYSYNEPPAGQDQPITSFHVSPLLPGQCKTEQVEAHAQPPSYGAWYLGAVADPGNTEQELIETNNTRASQVTGVGYGSDFTIESVSGPPSIRPGEPFTVSVRVCNQGTWSGVTSVQLVISGDTDIRYSSDDPSFNQDLPIGSFFTNTLAAGHCRTEQVEAWASVPFEGGWYLGAVADYGEWDEELVETNNTRASVITGVGYQPDYVIRDVSGPPSIMPGQPFTASVTVCNQGTMSGYTEVALVLSEDTEIRFSPNGHPESQDQLLDFVYLSGPLPPGQCRTEQVEAYVQVPWEGAWHLGAVADPYQVQQELLEENNTRASEPTGIGYMTDYVIREVSGPASTMPSRGFTASVTVCNQGTVGGGTEVVLVLSADSDIRYSYDSPPHGQDLLLSSFYMELAAGQCRTEQVQTSAPVSQEGPWYLGAIADPGRFETELIETNNTRASRPMGVGYRPDHVIQEVRPPASAQPGHSFMTAVTVCNQGTMPGATEVRLVLSEDTEINLSSGGPQEGEDPTVGYLYVGLLQPGQCRTEQVESSVWPPHDGAWYVGAVADPGNYEPELIETNNTGISDPMGIGYQTDYRIQSVTGPASVRPGDPFTASVTVCNQGTVSGSTQVQLVLSEDSDIRFSYSSPHEDMPVGSFYTGPLAAGQCVTEQVETYANAQEDGVWYLGAVADPGNYEQEFLETNNTLASEPMGIGFQADLKIQAVSGPASVLSGDTFTATVTVCNQGTVAVPATVALVLSEDTDIRFSYSGSPGDDMQVGSLYVLFPIQPGECVTEQVEAYAWAPQDGTWYLGAVADPGNYEQEFLETNNTLASDPMGIGFGADYRIQSVTGPASVIPGESFTASVTVCNQGTMAGATDVMLVLSNDTRIHFSWGSGPDEEEHLRDMPLMGFYTGPLAAGQCMTEQVETSAWVEDEGIWYLGAVADPGRYEQELIETNNSRASEPVGFGYQTDFRIQSVTGPASVRPGDPFTASVTVCNQGTIDGAAQVQLVLSEDTDIRFSYSGPPSGQDLPLGSFYTGELEEGQCMTQQVQASASVPHEGIWYLGAVADPGNHEQEFLETNNTLASEAVGVGHAADFRIQSVAGPASARPGDPFMVDVTVCNQGTTDGSAEVALVLSKDTLIRFSYSGPPGQGVPLTSFVTGMLMAGQCTTQQVEASAWPQEPGGWYLGAVADPGNNEQELIETNNTRASGLMGFGYDADLVIQVLTAPGSVTMGQPYEATVEVCNQGIASSPAEVQLVLSEDTDIRFSYSGPPGQDLPVEFLSFSNLDPGQCAAQNVTLGMSPPDAGNWYLGAVADPGQYMQELIETNNTRASGVISFQY